MFLVDDRVEIGVNQAENGTFWFIEATLSLGST